MCRGIYFGIPERVSQGSCFPACDLTIVSIQKCTGYPPSPMKLTGSRTPWPELFLLLCKEHSILWFETRAVGSVYTIALYIGPQKMVARTKTTKMTSANLPL